MILTTHIITGGILGGISPNLWLAAILGLASHYLLDAIPHWDYLSPEFKKATNLNKKFFKEKAFWQDFIKITIDIFVGLLILTLLGRLKDLNFQKALIGSFFAILPDPIQFLSWTFGWRFLKYSDKLQVLAHSKKEPSLWPGLAIQIALIILSITLI